MENNKSIENEAERKSIIKKLSLTCKTDLEEKDISVRNESKPQPEINENIEDLMNDQFFEQYLKQAFEEMQKKKIIDQ